MSTEDIINNIQRVRKDSLEIKRILVGVAGGSAAGKTTLCTNIRKEMTYDGCFNVVIVPLDCFYKNLDKTIVNVKDYNFDHPDSLDFDEAYECLVKLLNGQNAEIPRYNFNTHAQEEEKDIVEPTEVILFEGILSLYDQRIRDLMQYKIFMHCDDDIRLCRRLLRDVKERGRDVAGVLHQYNRFVKRSFDEYIRPTMNYADMIVPGSRNNMVSVQFIVQHLKNKAKQIGVYKKTVKRQIVFDGDVVESFEHNILKQAAKKEGYSTSEDLTFKKAMVFPTKDEMKKDIHRQFEVMTDKFTYKRAMRIFKDFQKDAMSLWEKLILLNDAEAHQVQALDLNVFLNERETIELDEVKEYVIIAIPVLLPELEAKITEACAWMQEKKPATKIVFSALLSSLAQFANLKDTCPNILHFVNILCIANRDKFKKNIQEHYLDEEEHPFFDPLIFHEKLYRRIKKTLDKHLAKHNKNKIKSQASITQ